MTKEKSTKTGIKTGKEFIEQRRAQVKKARAKRAEKEALKKAEEARKLEAEKIMEAHNTKYRKRMPPAPPKSRTSKI